MASWRLIDGFNMAFRAFYAVPDLVRSGDKFPTGALHGWVRTLWKLEDTLGKGNTVVFFDLGGSARHRELLPEYKAQRGSMPDELRAQIPLLKELSRLMGYAVVQQEGVEADDLIGSAALRLSQKGETVAIVSSDKDFGQLVGGNISQVCPPPTANPKLGWRTLDAEKVKEKFGVGPERIVDYLALVGDASDNIKGIEGVGPKTAAKWLNEFGSASGLLEKWNWVKPDRFRIILNHSRELIERNLQLVPLKTDCDIPDTMLTAPAVDKSALKNFLESYELKANAREVDIR